MKEKISPYLKSLLDKKSIAAQYRIEGSESKTQYNDPLMEDDHEVVKGLIHKYKNRAFLKVSYQCASHCRFCTRIRQIGNPDGTLTNDDIAPILNYLKLHPEINDLILSGGDPLYTPKLTIDILEKIRLVDSIKVIRIGTRLPLQSPKSFDNKLFSTLFELIDKIGNEKPFYILLHIEHPDELTDVAISVIKRLRKLKVTLLTQTVFLKNINDNFDTLFSLFQKVYELGCMPYYLYHCDNVKGLEHFQGDKANEKKIAMLLREHLSGIATPLFVEDIENGYGKWPV